MANTLFCRLETGIGRGFGHCEDHVLSIGVLACNSSLIRFAFEQSWVQRLFGYYEILGRKPAPRITNDFLTWVERVPRGRPFFAFLNYFDAHMPYLPPRDFARRFGCTTQLDTYIVRYARDRCLPSNTTIDEIESMRNAYDGAIAYLDYDLKRLFAELRRRGLLDRTLVVLVSDHGEEFGEHGTFGHGVDLHIQSIRVPLILRFPHIVPGGVNVPEPVSLRNIPATIISLLGLPEGACFPGGSLLRYLDSSNSGEPKTSDLILSELAYAPEEPEWAPVSKGDMKSLVIGDIHHIRNGDGTEEVYDLRDDPVELNDLISTPRGAGAAKQAGCILRQMTR